MLPEWVTDRGVAVSFGVTVVVLLLAAPTVARVLGVGRGRVEDLLWWGTIAFLVAGRAVAVAVASPALLLDPMVLVRFTDAVEPLAGAAAALAVAGWRGRRAGPHAVEWAIAVSALGLAAAAYDLACPLRAACHGAPSSLPLAFPMHGLAEPRLATPFVEGIVLLVVLATAVRLLDRWATPVVGWALLAALAGTRLLLLPLGAAPVDLPSALALGAGGAIAAVLSVRARPVLRHP